MDTERAALVSQAYRYAIRKDENTIALYPNSQSIELDTNLDAIGGQALAQDIFSVSGVSARTFTLSISGALYPDDFIGGAPRHLLVFSRHAGADPAKVYTVIAAKTLIAEDRTIVTVRG